VLRRLQPPWNRAGVERGRVPWNGAVLPSVEAIRQNVSALAESSLPGAAREPSLLVRDRSTVGKPVQLVWAMADEMFAANPAVSRREVIAECVRRGVAVNTAKTQYSAWRAVRGPAPGA